MSKGTLSQQDFSIGEIRPDLMGKTKAKYYQSALKKARNVVLSKAGVLMNAPGTTCILPGKFPTMPNRIIPFKVAFNQQYSLVFGNNYIHIINNGVPVFNSTATFNTGDPIPITLFPNGVNQPIGNAFGTIAGMNSNYLANGMLVQIQAAPSSITENLPFAANSFNNYFINRWFVINNVSIGSNGSSFNITDLYGNTIDTTHFGIYVGGLVFQTVYEIASPYAASDLSLLKWAQSFDVMQLRHHLYPRYQLITQDITSWVLSVNTAWPTQQQLASALVPSGGNSGNINYYYKVTTYNLDTKQESLPCPIADLTSLVKQNVTGAQVVANGIRGTNSVLIDVASSSGFFVGQTITLYQPIYSPGFGKIYLNTGVPYTIYSLGGNQIGVLADSNAVPVGGATYSSGTYVYASTANTKYQIASISNTNPMVITLQSANTDLANGQEVTIQGTGIFGLDGLTFNVTVLTTTTFQLNGVNAANYNLAGFVSSTSTIMSATAIQSTNLTPSVANPITVEGSVVNPATYTSNIVFLIYASPSLNGPFGFIGEVVPGPIGSTFSFLDQGIPPDTTYQPKNYIPLFQGVGNYPSACSFYQQRLVEFATDNNPQGVYASVIGDYNDFSVHDPVLANDAIILAVWSNELQQIFDSVDCGYLILITDMGPMLVSGDTSGVFAPDSPLIKKQLFAGGAQAPRPLSIFKDVIYLEASQGCIRNLQIEIVFGIYVVIQKSDDISLLSSHLLQNSPIVAWDYKQYPDPQIFAVQANGKIVVIHYFKEQESIGFSWLDTNNGTDLFQDIACVQEGNETFSYPLVQRATGTWIERFASRYYKDSSIDACFTHGTDVYNGLVTGGTTAILSGSLAANGSATATFSTAIGSDFTIGWQVNFKYLYGYDQFGNPLYYYARMQVTSTTANTIVGNLMEAIQASMQGPAISDIRVCTNVVAGLWNLEGQNVAVVADGHVVANPQDSGVPISTVVNGTITLPQSYGVINVGLPYLSDIQTVDMDNAGQGETFTDKKIGVPRVTLKLYQTGDIQAGPNFTEYLPPTVFMDHPKLRNQEGYDEETKLFTGILQVNIDTLYNFGGSIAIRNNQPLPMTLESVSQLAEIQS